MSVAIAIVAGSYLIMQLLAGMKADPEQRPIQQVRRAVKADTVRYGPVAATFESAGRLGSLQYVELIAEVQGEILATAVPLKKGQRFAGGALLVSIFDDEAEYSLKASRARFLNLFANALPDIRIDYPARYDEMLSFFESVEIEKPLPPLPEIESLQIKTFLSGRGILNEYFTIKSAEVRLQKYQIYAPFNGTYSDVYLEAGSIANPGTRIARMIRTDKLELEVPVEVENIKWISEGQEVTVFSEDRTMQWTGHVVRETGFVDPASQSVSVFISVDPEMAKPLFEGQYLRALFNDKIIEDGMVIPRNAVFNANQVFSIEEGKLKKRTIEVLKVNNETLVFNGLTEGSVIVTEPLANAREGIPVEVR